MSSEDSTDSSSEDEEEEDRETITPDEDTEDGEKKKDEKYSDSDEFSSITGFGTKNLMRQRELDSPPAIQKSVSGTKTNTSEQVIQMQAGEEEGEKIKELFHNTFCENGPTGLGILDALQISVILEEMSDQLDIIGMSIDAPQVDLRSKASVESDLGDHRPKVTVPATYDPHSNSFFKEKYILRQHYTTVASRRIERMCNDSIGSRFRKRLTAVLREFGVHRYSMKGKVQAERTQMTIILDNVATELIQDFTFNTLIKSIDQEKEMYEGMKVKVEKSVKDKHYITESKDMLKRLRIEKRKAKKEMQHKMWEFEDNRQELLKRKELEFLYVNHNALMTKARMKKMCAKAERSVKDVMDNVILKKEHYEYAHFLMLDIIYKKYKEAQRRLEYWVDKYEMDKEALQASLDQMKADRARDLERIDWLKAMITDYDQIVLDDRRIRKIFDDRVKFDKLQNKKAVKIQAWWRGEMYRKSLGPYNPKKKGKDKGKK